MLSLLFTAFHWFAEEIKAIALSIYAAVMNGFASVLEQFPVPDFMVGVGTHTLPDAVSFFAAPFQLEYGIGIIVSAYISRFVLRRIPGIG